MQHPDSNDESRTQLSTLQVKRGSKTGKSPGLYDTAQV